MRAQNLSPNAATKQLNGLSIVQKQNLLAEQGLDLEALPLWQKRGFAAVWQEFEKVGFNPVTQAEVHATRKRLEFETALVEGEEIGNWLRKVVAPR